MFRHLSLAYGAQKHPLGYQAVPHGTKTTSEEQNMGQVCLYHFPFFMVLKAGMCS